MERNYSSDPSAVTQRRFRAKKKSEGHKYCAFWIHESVYTKVRRVINMIMRKRSDEIDAISEAVEMLEDESDMVIKIVKNRNGLGVEKEKYCGWLIKG